MKNLIITGVKHSGKSTQGKLIAQKSCCAFYDMDDLIMNTPDAAHFASVRELYKQKGIEYFQQKEIEGATDFCRRFNPGTKKAVLSLGGGTIENDEAMKKLADNGFIVYLWAPEELLYKRIEYRGLPPFLSKEDPRGDFHKLYKKRDALNRKVAEAVIELSDIPREENAEKIFNILRNDYGW